MEKQHEALSKDQRTIYVCARIPNYVSDPKGGRAEAEHFGLTPDNIKWDAETFIPRMQAASWALEFEGSRVEDDLSFDIILRAVPVPKHLTSVMEVTQYLLDNFERLLLTPSPEKAEASIK